MWGLWRQKQVYQAWISDTEYCGMQLLIPAWGTCFWHQSPHISRVPVNQPWMMWAMNLIRTHYISKTKHSTAKPRAYCTRNTGHAKFWWFLRYLTNVYHGYYVALHYNIFRTFSQVNLPELGDQCSVNSFVNRVPYLMWQLYDKICYPRSQIMDTIARFCLCVCEMQSLIHALTRSGTITWLFKWQRK